MLLPGWIVQIRPERSAFPRTHCAFSSQRSIAALTSCQTPWSRAIADAPWLQRLARWRELRNLSGGRSMHMSRRHFALNSLAHLSVVAVASTVAWTQQAYAQIIPAQPPRISPATIVETEYVRLEVTLVTTATNKVITFNNACPKQPLWGIDIKQLFKGTENVTLGVAITAPGMTALEFTPVSIDRKQEGLLGLKKSCDVMIDQMRYLSPAYYVKRYKNAQFKVAPTYKVASAPNPALAATIDAAASFALKLSGVPAETAKPYQDQIKALLSQVGVSGNERFPKYLIIAPGPVPSDDDFRWQTSGLFRKAPGESKPVDVVLTARLIPVNSLIGEPGVGADGRPQWTISDVLTSPFAADLAPGANPGGTLGSYIEAAASTDLGNFRKAATKAEASNACDPVRVRVRQMGLSDRDEALLMWAVTHNQPPSRVSAYDIDELNCLADAWHYLPPQILATRRQTPDPTPVALVPATIRQMKQTTQIDDAFAVFFKASAWAERRRHGSALFAHPVTYTDPAGALFASSTSVENVDQWLALHTAASPVADRVGCYTYLPAAETTSKSVMYAIADTIGQGKPAQVLLIATFANAAANGDAKIGALEVASAITAEQKAKIVSANGTQCASGYRPALAFGD